MLTAVAAATVVDVFESYIRMNQEASASKSVPIHETRGVSFIVTLVVSFVVALVVSLIATLLVILKVALIDSLIPLEAILFQVCPSILGPRSLQDRAGPPQFGHSSPGWCETRQKPKRFGSPTASILLSNSNV